jgi:hypothetical protein
MSQRSVVRKFFVAQSPAVLLVALVVATLMQSAPVFAQARFEVPLKVSDGVDSTFLYFGLIPGANYCINDADSLNGHVETFLPPMPPSGVFDARLVWPRTGSGAACFDQGSPSDYRPSISSAQRDTFKMKSQLGTGAAVIASWPAGLSSRFTSLTIRFIGSSGTVNTDMLTNTSVDFTDAGDPATVTIISGGLQPLPATPTLASPADRTIVPPDVTVSWGTVSGATAYHLQVSTDSLFAGSFLINDSTLTGTSRGFTGLPVPTTYYWRVSAGNTLGFSAYSAFWRFTTGSVPSAPTLVFPANGSIAQPVSLTLRWNSDIVAQRYDVQVSTDSTFSTFFLRDSLTTDTTHILPGLVFSTKYYWRVRGRNNLGWGSYSTRFDFTTQFQPPVAPTLQSPANGSTNTATTLTLAWNTIASATSYRLQVATSSNFTTGIVLDDSLLTGTSRSVGPLSNSTQYYWHVSATNPGGTGPYSTTWNFTTIVSAPPAPTLVSPADGATNVSLTPIVTWVAAPTATSYRVLVARDSAFTIIAFDDSTVASTSRQIPLLLSNTPYYWKVRGKNIGGIGPYSVQFRFTTTAAPPAPTPVSPADSATRVPRTPTFVWTRVAAALSYQLQIGTDENFTTVVINDSAIVDTARTTTAIPYGARLFWHVRSLNTSGPSAYTAARRFTVMLEPPGGTTQLAPANNATLTNAVVTPRWTSALLAASYQLRLAYDTLMTNVYLDTTVVDTAVDLRLVPNTATYWNVRGRNIEGSYGPVTGVRRFNVGNVPPAPPIPLLPADWDSLVSRTALLTWLGSPGAIRYRVQMSLSLGFGSLVLDDSTLTELQFRTPVLSSNLLYYWRILAKGTGPGWSAPSVTRRYRTGTQITGVESDPTAAIPSGFVLRPCYPNPFNPSTTLSIELSGGAFVSLGIFDMLGREVQTLVSEQMPAGVFTVRWNGQTANNEPVPSGVYFARLTATRGAGTVYNAMQKLILLK